MEAKVLDHRGAKGDEQQLVLRKSLSLGGATIIWAHESHIWLLI